MIQQPNSRKDYKELRMIIRSLFAYEMSRNWLIRLIPIIAGYWLYRWSQDTILMVSWIIWSVIEIVRALNVLLFQSNIALIQANDFVLNLKKLLGIRQGEMIARHPDSDFSGAKGGASDSATARRQLQAGTFLQNRLAASLGEEQAAPLAPAATKPAILPEKPAVLHFLRIDPHTRHHIYQVDSAEYACKSIADTARNDAKSAQHAPTPKNLSRAVYWGYVAEFVKNDKLARAGKLKLELTNPEETAEGKKI